MNNFTRGLIKGVVASATSFGAFYLGTLLGLKVRVLSCERNLDAGLDNGKEDECYDGPEL